LQFKLSVPRCHSINDIVFLGIAVYFLLTIERRMKRRRALGVIHLL